MHDWFFLHKEHSGPQEEEYFVAVEEAKQMIDRAVVDLWVVEQVGQR